MSHVSSPANSRYRWLALAAVLAVILISALVWFSRQPAPGAASSAATPSESMSPKPSMTVTVTQPSRETLSMSLEANGNVSAWQEASVGAEVSGLRLAQVNVNVGDAVRKGQLLAVFASDSAQAETLQSQASAVQAEASYLNAKADADRARSIQDTGALSASQVAQYLTQEKVAKAQWEAAKAVLGATQIRLGNTSVKAPDDGVISARSATVGAVVGSGQELFRLVRQSRMEWRAEVTASEVGRIEVGQLAQVTMATGASVEGKVRAIAPSANEQTRNILVYVDLPRHKDLKAGTFARGVFAIGQSEALTLPTPAIVVRDGSNFVFAVDEVGKASALKVQTGRRVGERVEILSGLKGDERVAVQGAGFLNEGDLVKVVQ
ncbi:efflux RND transporter periplasmic adaptor subunit [Hydrogenophaga sp.]|uniref:efflux RND transporter periplasmic adaptor subunit n=1 Tax=Hydrogenophaga sp. TaxID=1904254 RepID=UPI0025C24133|nr:efflux RND transporter periplasmic adaptor subunit [Hydrogenophaga sp.]